MTTDLDDRRRQAADLDLENYDFGYPVKDGSGWEWETPGTEWTKPLFFEPDEPGGDSVKGHFTVRFREGTAEIEESHGVVDGQVVGNPMGPRP